MRDYAKIVPKFWMGGTGKVLRKPMQGASEGASMPLEGTLMALYLMSSPHSNMLGLYCQPILYAAHETGMGIEGAQKGLQACIDAGFCKYDPDTEMVWVIEMARYQVAEALKPADKRCAGIQKDYEALPDNLFLGEFFDKYRGAFHLSKRRGPTPQTEHESGGEKEAPSKPHRSQEQEQEQEQDISAEQFSLEGASSGHGSPDVITLTLNDLTEHPVLQTDIDQWALAYPGVDVLAELRRMKVWLTANPKKRKTESGIGRFIVNWLSTQQDRPAMNGTPRQQDGGSSVAPWEGAK